MKRLYSNLFFALPIAAATLVGCSPTDNNDVENSYPSNNVQVKMQQNMYVAEITAVDCRTCPITQEAMEIMKAQHPGKIIPISLHADTLFVEDANPVASALGIDQTNNFLLFINQLQLTSSTNPLDEMNTLIEANIPPLLGVGHATREVDSAWLIYPKVEFFSDLSGDYYIQSYVTMGNIAAKTFGSIDLIQQVSDPRLKVGSGTEPTKWTANGGQVDSVTYLFKAGDDYKHEDVLLAAGVNDTNYMGLPLSVISPLGANYFLGDVFGNQYTPIEIVVPKPEFDMPAYLGAELHVVTIIWQRFAGSPDVYSYVNGYYSKF